MPRVAPMAAAIAVARLPVVVTTTVAADLDEARGRRIRASHGNLLHHASATSNRVMTLEVRYATTQEASRAVTSTTSNRPATPLPAFLHQASRQATATTFAADALAEAEAPAAVITQAEAELVGPAVRAHSTADKALPGGSPRGPPRILDLFGLQRRAGGRKQLLIQ